jgi:hypothetical protein
LFSSTEAARSSPFADSSIFAVLPFDRAISVILPNGQFYRDDHFLSLWRSKFGISLRWTSLSFDSQIDRFCFQEKAIHGLTVFEIFSFDCLLPACHHHSDLNW